MDLERDNNNYAELQDSILELSYSIETSIRKFLFSVVYTEIDNDMSALEEALLVSQGSSYQRLTYSSLMGTP